MRPTPAKLLAHAKTPAFLVTDLTNIAYLTGLKMTAGVVLVTPRSCMLFCDGRYSEAAATLVRSGVRVCPSDALPMAMKSLRRCGCESEDVTVARFASWKRKFPSTKFIHTEGILGHFRRTKDAEELQHLLRARRVTRELLRRIPAVLRVGVTERAIAWKLEIWARELGADGLSFAPIVAFGTHTSRPHHHPTTRPLRRGHVVQIDVGAKVRGYCGDLSEVYFTQKPSPLEQRVYRAVRDAKDAAEDAVKAGVTTAALDGIARAVLKKAGLEEFFTHSLGHGVGLDVHEGVTLSSKRKPEALLRREVITIEPGVYLPGKFGIRLEDMVLVR